MSLAKLVRLQHPGTSLPDTSTECSAGYPMQLVAMDIVGLFPESVTGSQYILMVSDYFTKCVKTYAIPNQEAPTIAKVLVNEFFCWFGPQRQLHSDQGRKFGSKLIEGICNSRSRSPTPAPTIPKVAGKLNVSTAHSCICFQLPPRITHGLGRTI